MSKSLGPVEREILDEISADAPNVDAALRARPVFQHDDPWAEDYMPERDPSGDSPDEQWVSFDPPWLY